MKNLFLRSLSGREIIALILIILVAASIRFYDLTRRTISHNEIYTPGIELPLGISAPRPRLNIQYTLSSLLTEAEPHPPAYYLFMLGWTKIWGSSILSLRFPSFLFGIACVLLTYLIGYLENHRIEALLAAGLLALNGYHVLWSQISKMYMMGCFLVSLSTLLLILMTRQNQKNLTLPLLYLISTLTGLATVIWFWPIFICQMLWVLWNGRRSLQFPGLSAWQFLILILSTPLFSLAVYQARRPSYLSNDPLEILRVLSQYFGFGILFEVDPFTPPYINVPIIVQIVLTISGLFLLVIGLWHKQPVYNENISTIKSQASIVTLLCCLGACISILAFCVITLINWGANQQTLWNLLIFATAVLPWLVFTTFRMMKKHWNQYYEYFKTKSIGGLDIFSDDLSSFLAFLPILLIIFISPIVPLMASRGVLLYVPFLLLVISRGIVTLIRRTPFGYVLILMVMVIYPIGLINYHHGHHEDANDYKGLSEKWIPEVQTGDLIFVRRYDPVTSPIYYYMTERTFNFVAYDFMEAINNHPDSRIWFLYIRGHFPTNEMKEALRDYRVIRTLDAFRTQAWLYNK